MNQITVTAMVLAVSPVGEYDRRVVLLTKERGKLAVFARGARRQGSALLGVTSPFSFGEFTLYEGRTSYTLMSASVSNYFEELRTDVEGAYYGFYFMDLASYYAREAADERELLKLLYQSLRALTNVHIPNLRTIVIEGEGPQLGECVLCGNEAKEGLFSVRRGGLVCRQCEGRAGDARPLLGSTVYAMQYIAATPLEKLYTFVVKEEVLEELEQVTGAYLEAYVGRHFKSLDILETVIGTDRRFKEDLT